MCLWQTQFGQPLIAACVARNLLWSAYQSPRSTAFTSSQSSAEAAEGTTDTARAVLLPQQDKAGRTSPNFSHNSGSFVASWLCLCGASVFCSFSILSINLVL